MNTILSNIQKNTFIVLILVILFFSFSLGYSVKSIVVLFLNPEKIEFKNTDSVKISTEVTSKSVSLYEGMVEGNLIRGKIISEITKPTDKAKEQVLLDDPSVEEILVTGIIAGSWNSSFARVTIKEKNKEESEEFSLGRKIGGYILKSISAHSIMLHKNGINLKVEVGETIKEAKIRWARRFDGTCQGTGYPVPKESGYSPIIVRPISRTDFKKYVGEGDKLLINASFGPNIEDGKITGYKIYQVAATHLFYQLGARSGDIVRRVNGIPLNNSQKMLELWSNIQNSTIVTIDIERKGNILGYEFHIRN